jgi:SAM-dependent methyltransferase
LRVTTFELNSDLDASTIVFGASGDLDRLAEAHHFFNWILDEFEPWIGNNILEVGAGTGTITNKLLDRRPSSAIVGIEPAANLWQQLIDTVDDDPRVDLLSGTLGENVWSAPLLRTTFDTALYLNVMEHIEDDLGEMRLAADALRPGGSLLIFVPAMPSLYSPLDEQAGHYRRYTKRELKAKVEAAGFTVRRCVYFDAVSALPYWLNYKIFRRRTISASSGWLFDRILVPLSKFVQAVVPSPPIGKNLLLVAQRPAAAID